MLGKARIGVVLLVAMAGCGRFDFDASSRIADGSPGSEGEIDGPLLGDATEATEVIALVGGQFDTFALRADGHAFAWGENASGELGVGVVSDMSLLPLPVLGRWRRISSGEGFTCGENYTTGELWCWGLGTPTPYKVMDVAPQMFAVGSRGMIAFDGANVVLYTTETGVPELALSTPANAIAISMLWRTACYATATAVNCIGLNDQAQVGDGTTMDATTWKNALNAEVHDVGTGHAQTCALGPTRVVMCWGGTGPLGDTMDPRLTPTQFALGMNNDQLAVGGHHVCVLRAGGMRCAGGYVGDNGSFIDIPGTWRFIVSGEIHTCGVRDDGNIYCLGDGDVGELGNGGTADQDTPTLVTLP